MTDFIEKKNPENRVYVAPMLTSLELHSENVLCQSSVSGDATGASWTTGDDLAW